MKGRYEYHIEYTDHRGDKQYTGCSAFEDAERLAQYLADLHGKAELNDGHFVRHYQRKSS